MLEIARPWTTLLSDPKCNNPVYHWCFVFITVYYWVTFRIFDFYRAPACCRRDIDIAPPSVCPSNAGFKPKRLHILWNFYTNRRGKSRRREARVSMKSATSPSQNGREPAFPIFWSSVHYLRPYCLTQSDKIRCSGELAMWGSDMFHGQICPCNSRGGEPCSSSKCFRPGHMSVWYHVTRLYC